MDFRLDYETSDEIRGVINDLGRTEDVKFSPNNRRLALVGFNAGRIVIFDLFVAFNGGAIEIVITDYFIVASPSLKFPHGVAFIDNDRIIVASREGCVDVFQLPAAGASGRTLQLTPVLSITGNRFRPLHSPGSVAIHEIKPGRYEVLVCNNFAHVVTAHTLKPNGLFCVRNRGALRWLGLSTPDGICLSESRKWIAISNHDTGEVLIYPTGGGGHRMVRPVGVCQGIACPHGIRFAESDRYLLVAGAAEPYVHVFESEDGEWRGARRPSKTVRVLDEETFLCGRHNPEEGGPKGIDLDRTGRLLVTTCEEQILSFFDARRMCFAER